MKLYDLTAQAARKLGVAHELQKITDLRQIMALRVMVTPALVVNGSVKLSGKVPSLEEMKAILSQAAAAKNQATDEKGIEICTTKLSASLAGAGGPHLLWKVDTGAGTAGQHHGKRPERRIAGEVRGAFFPSIATVADNAVTAAKDIVFLAVHPPSWATRRGAM